MQVQLRWKASLSATCLHVAACMRAGFAGADRQLTQTLGEPAARLFGELGMAGWPADAMLQQLAALSAEYENNRELVKRCAVRLNLPPVDDAILTRIAGAVADLEATLLRQQPELVDELAVRGGPLREQWEARGGGLLREVARLTEAAVVPASAEVVLVSPYLGGHGTAHPWQNRITIEAVLVNPLPELPETVRLAWLASQLNADLPRYADVLRPGTAGRALRVAAVPPVLAAASSVELVPPDAAPVELALDAWRLSRDLPANAAEQLGQWWSAWLDHPQSWPVAVAALDRMLWP
jgi:hypothetical protein